MRNQPSNFKTRTIAGHRLTLLSGVRYWASRPGATRGRKDFPVTIRPINSIVPGSLEYGTVVIPKLDYEASTRLINAFNNGPISFDGRVW